jgi:hypothetical protein
VATAKKISTDQVHALFTKMGLPVVVDAEAESEGFRARAWGGRNRDRLVKAAESVEVFYRYGRYRAVTGSDLRDLPEVRAHFQWAVDKAPRYGYSIEWNPNLALMHITRADS